MTLWKRFRQNILEYPFADPQGKEFKRARIKTKFREYWRFISGCWPFTVKIITVLAALVTIYSLVS